MLALLYYLNSNWLSIGCERFLYGKYERLVARGLLHKADDSVGSRDRVRFCDPSSDKPYCIEFFGEYSEIIEEERQSLEDCFDED